MSEIAKYEAYKKKLQGICDENNLVFRFRNNQYPITLTIRPVSGLGEQLSLLESSEESYISPDAAIVFSFVDGAVTYKVLGRFIVSEALFNKVKNLFKNMLNCWIQYFFRDVVTKNLLSGQMPVIDESEAEDEDLPQPIPDDEPEDSEDEENTGNLTYDDYLLKEATALVRAENKATTSLLQRRLNIGYSKAGMLMDALEKAGVVGPYNGPEGREVLPFDVPDDAEG